VRQLFENLMTPADRRPLRWGQWRSLRGGS
jgi:hypothetical protein